MKQPQSSQDAFLSQVARDRSVRVSVRSICVHGDAILGAPFAGGFRFPLPGGGFAVSQNITPDAETGIGKWTRQQFIALFKTRASDETAFPVKPGERQTMMPWSSFGGMTESDLGSIYDYLRTLPPVKNRVETFEATN
jgi:hypothetical protein